MSNHMNETLKSIVKLLDKTDDELSKIYGLSRREVEVTILYMESIIRGTSNECKI